MILGRAVCVAVALLFVHRNPLEKLRKVAPRLSERRSRKRFFNCARAASSCAYGTPI